MSLFVLSQSFKNFPWRLEVLLMNLQCLLTRTTPELLLWHLWHRGLLWKLNFSAGTCWFLQLEQVGAQDRMMFSSVEMIIFNSQDGNHNANMLSGNRNSILWYEPHGRHQLVNYHGAVWILTRLLLRGQTYTGRQHMRNTLEISHLWYSDSWRPLLRRSLALPLESECISVTTCRRLAHTKCIKGCCISSS